MSERPILFSGLMVQALLEGRKTQTRRLRWRDVLGEGPPGERATAWQKVQPGDRLWVREGWAPMTAVADASKPARVWYRYGHEEEMGSGPRVDVPWRHSIHMPRWASRVTLTVTAVRVQRLQAISEADALEEGVGASGPSPGMEDALSPPPHCGAVENFAALWNSLHKPPHAWADNPEVVAIAFAVEQRAAVTGQFHLDQKTRKVVIIP